MSEIRYIEQSEIDLPKYNGCVHYALNSQIYGLEWYLKNAVRHFDILVEGDYSSVMPLPYSPGSRGKKKLLSSPVIQNLGIYSVNLLSKARIAAFLKAIPSHFTGGELSFHQGLDLPEMKYWVRTERVFGKLTLSSESGGEEGQTLREYTRAEHSENLQPLQLNIEDFVGEFVTLKGNIQQKQVLLRILYNAKHRGIGFPMAYADADDEICTLAYFILYENTAYNLFILDRQASLPNMAYLLSNFIKVKQKGLQNIEFQNPHQDLMERFGADIVSYPILKRKSFLRSMGLGW